jgi:glycosyltransferase involved in cell wall biosynthesis
MTPRIRPTVDVVIPVHNEEATLAGSVATLIAYLAENLPYDWRVVIADHASTDATPAIGAWLEAADPRVTFLRLEEKGRGRALRTAWLGSDADVVAYMDVDLSTNLESFPPLVAAVASGHSQVAIGTRLQHAARVRRRLKREVLSRGYNLLVHLLFRARFSDAQCGFKAVRGDIAHALVPHVVDDGWFFDTELLLLAERNGLRIHEVPVDWIEDLDSRVDIPRTIAEDLRGLLRVRRSFLAGGGRVTAPAPASTVARAA